MDRVALDLGFIQIYWYSICLFVGMLAASFVIYREAKRRGISAMSARAFRATARGRGGTFA